MDTQTIGLQTMPVRLDDLLKMRWEDNPKEHATDLIEESVRTHGFNDPPEFCPDFQLLVVGHGRAELLDRMYHADPKAPPKNIGVAEDGMWLVPCIPLEFDDKNHAYLYAIKHNRSNTKTYNPGDWKQDKLAKARAFGQLDLFGFGDANLAAAPTQPFILPELAPFDASKLPDAPGAQLVAPQSYVLMITFPSRDQMLEALKALTYGERKVLPEAARLCSLEGSELLAKWQSSLSQIAVSEVPPTRVDVQNPLEIGDLKVAPYEVPAWDVAPSTPQGSDKVPEVKTPKPRAEKGPESVGGLCVKCGGSGKLFNTNPPTECPQCHSTGEMGKLL